MKHRDNIVQERLIAKISHIIVLFSNIITSVKREVLKRYARQEDDSRRPGYERKLNRLDL